jgi:hypothetical protein
MLPPPPTLEGVIDFLWVDERSRLSPRSHEWRIVADDAPHVIYARFADGRTGGESHPPARRGRKATVRRQSIARIAC